MRVVVVGASGRIGVPLSDLLEAQGHEVARLHRSSRSHPADLRTGAGLAHALEGIEVIVNASNQAPPRAPGPVMIGGTQALLDASPVHHVLVSIVGTDALAPANAYYAAKLEQERLVAASGRPFSIVRSTQLHELVGAAALRLRRARLEVHFDGLLQPVSAREVAAVLARTATHAPTGSTIDIGGPDVLTVTQLRAGRGLAVPLPAPAKLRAALRSGAFTAPDADIRGVLSYAQWLAEARARPWRPSPR